MNRHTFVKSSLVSSQQAVALANDVISQTVEDYAHRIKAHMQAGMRLPKHGRVYKKPDGRLHRASAPGEPPAVDTGKLINSFETIFRRGGTEAEIRNEVPYAIYLEKGTKRMKKRPYAKPACVDMGPLFVASLKRRLQAAFAFA
jgi:hypothetical protein